jgi:MFS family permease
MYDFQIFGYYASAIAATFFPSGNEYASLMAALTTFGAGFLMRPLGAIVLGAYVDRRGRRAGLLLTLGLMAFGTLSIACTPSFAAIGLFAPLLVLLGRPVQGLSAGAENGGVSVYLSEIAHSWAQGLLCELANRKSTGRSNGRGAVGPAADNLPFEGRNDPVGLAHSAICGVRDYPAPVPVAAIARRDRGLSRAQTPPHVK